jgi:hypothetical protein
MYWGAEVYLHFFLTSTKAEGDWSASRICLRLRDRRCLANWNQCELMLMLSIFVNVSVNVKYLWLMKIGEERAALFLEARMWFHLPVYRKTGKIFW